MEDTTITNSAQRLLKLLELGSSVDGTITIRSAWAKILNVSDHDHQDLYIAFVRFLDLFKESQSQVQSLEGPLLGPATRGFLRIALGLNYYNWDAQWQNVKQYFDETTLLSLSVAAAFLHDRGIQEKDVEKQELASLRQEADSLLQDIVAADIEVELKSILVDLLHKLIEAIDAYNIGGAKLLKSVISESLGEFALYASVNNNVSEAGRSKAKQVWDFVLQVANVAAAAEFTSKVLKVLSVAAGNIHLLPPV